MEIKIIDATQTWELRQKVLWPNKELAYVKLSDDSVGTHYGLYDGDRLVSVLSTFERDGEVQFRKFATAKELQGQGYGTKLLQYVIDLSAANGAKAIWCNARKDKAAFYQRFGLRATDQEYERDGIPYVIMRRELPGVLIGERLARQMRFIVEVDKIKNIHRRNLVTGSERQETDAEHSWHLAVMAMLLAEHVPGCQVDILKVIKMVLIHDIVEIDAGDTYCYDEQAGVDKKYREQAAADRLFGLLPADQAQELRALWDEFEQRESTEARLADALDKLQPLLLHYNTSGKSWQENGITSSQVRERNKHTKDIADQLGRLVNYIIQDSIIKGYLKA